MTIEKTLFAAADKMRGSMDPGEYKHVALGLLFLRYIGVAFQRKYDQLLPEGADVAEDVDEYLAEGIFWVPKGPACAGLFRFSAIGESDENLWFELAQPFD